MSETLTPGGASLTLHVSSPERDDLVGLMVWHSAVNGFTPAPANLAYSGAGLVFEITALAPGVVRYVRYALISEIDPADYEVSAQLSGTPLAPAEVGANKTYLDGAGTLQGVSSGAGTAVKNANIALSAAGVLSGAGTSTAVSLTSIAGILQAIHLQTLTLAANSSITAGTASDGVVLDANARRITVMSNGVERVRLGYGVGVGAAYGFQVKNSLGKVMQDTADGVLIRGDIVQDNYSVGDSTTGGVDASYGSHNLAIGAGALNNPGLAKLENIAIGTGALAVTTASYNTAIGAYASARVSTGGLNVAVGRNAGAGITVSNFNVAIGDYAMSSDTGSLGDSNVAVGANALMYAATSACIGNVAVGTNAGVNVNGEKNTLLGDSAGTYQAGSYNTCIGSGSGGLGGGLATGSYNTTLGSGSGFGMGSGSYNTLIGNGAGSAIAPAVSRATILGGNDGAAASSNSVTLSDGAGAVRAYCDASGTWFISGGITIGGSALIKQPAPTVTNVASTLTAAALLGRIVVTTPAAAIALTLPTGALLEAALAGIVINQSVDWSVINTAASFAVTITAATGHTVVGNAAVAGSFSAQFRSRMTAANTFVTYRIG